VSRRPQPRRAAVLGSPVAHSLSPVLHGAAYAALGLAGWEYGAVQVDEDALEAFLDSLDTSWAGLSLTMPLKAAVLPLLDEVSPLAAAVGAVNTVLLAPADGEARPAGVARPVGGAGPVDKAGPAAKAGPAGEAGPANARSRLLHRRGENTDVTGIVQALRASGVEEVGWGCVLGGGATAGSALAALRDLGCRNPSVYVRSAARAAGLREAAARLDVQPRLLPWEEAWQVLSADVVVSTVPAGAADVLAHELDREVLPTTSPVLLDVVYAPWPTALAASWERHGGAVVGGFEMLLHQAAAQVELFTGQPAPLAAMRAAGQLALQERAESA
jgi:shikimate dehydrogenase